MKPNVLTIELTERGLPSFSVRTPSKVEDRVWDAVELAISCGWTPARFRNEVADAWAHALREEAKEAQRVLRGDR